MPRYMVTIEGTEYDITADYHADGVAVTLNGRKVKIERTQLQGSRSLLLIDDTTFEVDVRSNGENGRRTVFARGCEVAVSIEDYSLAQLRKTAGMSSGPGMEKTVRAPMPGLILDVKIKSGDAVVKGQPLLIIEAMKMENVIKAQGDGVIKEVAVGPGVSVEKSDKLMEFE